MRQHLYILILIFTLPLKTAGQSPNYSFDTDIFMLRNTIMPEFQYHYDDYTQYAPAALMVGLKACGYEGRSSWSRMLVSDAFSVASMATLVNGIKYSAQRLRPDASTYNSFPSGHTATAFMTATMLHKEYEGRNKWISIGGYSLAALTGVSRVMNNRHWMTDVMAGAVIGIGSVHLGYFITDKIFKDKHLNPGYETPELCYDPGVKHYVAEILMGSRFILGSEDQKLVGILPQRGSMAGLQIEIPLIPSTGVSARATTNSMIFHNSLCCDLYTVSAGGYWNLPFARLFEFQTKLMAGWARMNNGNGMDISGGVSISLITDNYFKIKVFGEFESISPFTTQAPWFNIITAGFSTGFFW